MPSKNFVKQTRINESFRNNQIKSMFDVQTDIIKKEYNINIPIENREWSIGLIVGSSGSGKSTIAKEIFDKNKFIFFEGFDWDNSKTILDNFDKELTSKEIVEAISKVGFNSPPDWLKPYNLLSNGEKFRVDLARIILESKKIPIVDEFTSVVDRQVAKIGSIAVSKFIRKMKRSFIAVSCHYDIIEYLQPDWIFDVNKNSFEWREVRQFPNITIKVYKTSEKKYFWSIFKRYHYLSSSLHNASDVYLGCIEDVPVCLCAILRLPNINKIMRVHRIVVLPDYQGIGIANKVLSFVCSLYLDKYKVYITTGNYGFSRSLSKSPNWILKSNPKFNIKNSSKDFNHLNKSISYNRLTCSFQFRKN